MYQDPRRQVSRPFFAPRKTQPVRRPAPGFKSPTARPAEHPNSGNASSLLRRVMTRKEFLLTIGGLLVAGGAVWFFGKHHGLNRITGGNKKTTAYGGGSSANTNGGDPHAQSSINKRQYSLSDPTSIWLVVNKHRPLSTKTFTPSGLVIPSIPLRSNITSTEKYVRSDTADALKKMVDAAGAEHIHLNLQSGYRSYQFQVDLYNSYVKQEGQAQADRESARPGYSEHQTGLAADLGGDSNPACNVAQCYATTTEGTWLANHCHEYGFVLRYPSDKESVTGYEYEPWHVRYVGTELAGEMHKEGVETLEEFFDLGAAPTYSVS